MKGAVWTFVIVLVLSAGALAYNFAEDNETRDRVRVVEHKVVVDPCKRPRSEACQRRIRLVLRELVRKHPRALRKLGLEPRDAQVRNAPLRSTGGGGADNPPQGGGPVGRVPPRRPNPPAPPSPPKPPSEPPPGVTLEAPVPVRVCTDLVRVNCG